MNIYQKLIEVRKEVPYLQKESKGHQYNYVGSSQVLAAVRAKMDELGLLLVPRVLDKRVAIEGKNIFTELDMTFTWVNAEKPDETIECPWYGQGMDISGEKGVGKALTYAEKYFLLKQFNIATDKDDPDSFQGRHESNSNVTPIQGGSSNSKDKPATNDERKKLADTMKSNGMNAQAMFEFMDITIGHHDTQNLTRSEVASLNKALPSYLKGLAANAQ